MLRQVHLSYSQYSRISINFMQKRFKTKKKKKVLEETNTERALQYFDTAYPPVYGSRWPSIRLALLSKHKYIALINNFGNYEDTIKRFENLGAFNVGKRFLDNIEFENYLKEKNKQIPQKEDLSEVEDLSAQKIRPSLIELDDEEKAALAWAEPEGHYLEMYRQRALAKDPSREETSMDLTNRVIVPTQFGTEASVMHDYIPSSKLKGLEDWIEETDVFTEVYQGDDEIGLKVERQKDLLTFPEMLKVYVFPKGNITRFPQPRRHELNVFDYYAFDGASLLPVLCLDVQLGERVLDLCAAPGGKSLLMLQSMLPGLLVSNDKTEGRTNRIHSVLNQYIPKDLDSIRRISSVTMRDGCGIHERDAYDKVLVDAPCLTDRHSLSEDDNSIFKTTRVKERLRMPELQSELLFAAIQAVRPGGSVVYSTCTLSPLQNDGVVHMALTQIWQETTIECSVVDLSYAIRPIRFLYRLGSNLGLRYGQVVLPSLLSNFGPMYVAKIKRIR
ncbi:unnamed protein product, partial [Meganyctiphanes norvegica]